VELDLLLRAKTSKRVRRGDALQSGDRIKVVIETGDIWDAEMLSLQNYQGVMEIQTAFMLVKQIQNARE
jgi:hypothetical protein